MELSNLVSSVRERGRDGSLFGAEVTLNTDNTTSENGHCKGCSKSKKPDTLTLELRILEMTCGFKLWVVRASGRQIHPGARKIRPGKKEKNLNLTRQFSTHHNLSASVCRQFVS
jgi:hypothetical protein